MVLGTTWHSWQATALRNGPGRRWIACAPTPGSLVVVAPVVLRGGAALSGPPWQVEHGPLSATGSGCLLRQPERAAIARTTTAPTDARNDRMAASLRGGS